MEKQIWQTIRSKLNDFFIQRIETSIERGIPDVHYCVDGVSGLKHLPKIFICLSFFTIK